MAAKFVKLSVGQFRKCKNGDEVRILNSRFLAENKLDEEGKPTPQMQRTGYVYTGEVVKPAKEDGEKKKGLEWDEKGKSWLKSQDKSFDLV